MTYEAFCNAHPDLAFEVRAEYADAIADLELHLQEAHGSGVRTIALEQSENEQTAQTGD